MDWTIAALFLLAALAGTFVSGMVSRNLGKKLYSEEGTDEKETEELDRFHEQGHARTFTHAKYDLPEKDFMEEEEFSESMDLSELEEELKGLSEEEIHEILNETGIDQ